MSKSDFAIFQERIENRLKQFQQQIQGQIKESEFRLTTRLGFFDDQYRFYCGRGAYLADQSLIAFNFVM